jgi:hypothetical protein
MIHRASRVALLVLMALVCAGLAAVSARADVDTRLMRCPFSFPHDMPPGVFCVYDGVARGSDGSPCGDRVMVIWSRLSPAFAPDDWPDEDLSEWDNVYFGFDMFPDLVLRAAVDGEAEYRAAISDYRLGPDRPRVRLQGTAELGFADGEGTEVLLLRSHRPIPASESCAFTSYDGTFVGVMTLPSGRDSSGPPQVEPPSLSRPRASHSPA